MSSVSFPERDASPEPISSSSTDHFYSSFIDAGASSGFQMNPLSLHPPRTPRTSIVSSSHTRGASIYEEKMDNFVEEQDADDSVDEAEEMEESRESRVQREDVWREMILTSNGRDKAFKLLQYSLRVYLLFHTTMTASRLFKGRQRPKWEKEFVKRLQSMVSGLSFSRKTLLLFNWLSPLTAIMVQQSVPFSAESPIELSQKKVKPFLHTALYAPPPVLLELVQAVADDLYTFSLLGLFSKRFGERAGRFSDWCWMIATLVGLVENGVERQVLLGLQHDVESRLYQESMSGATAKSRPASAKVDDRELKRLQRKDYWLQVTRAKLLMDLIFVSYDLFKFKRMNASVKAFSGLAAAILSAAKLYDRHKTILAKTPT